MGSLRSGLDTRKHAPHHAQIGGEGKYRTRTALRLLYELLENQGSTFFASRRLPSWRRAAHQALEHESMLPK
jgi:hypothetical protein